MPGETGMLRSEIQTMAETAVKIDRLLTEAKEMAAKLRETSDALKRIAAERDDNAQSE
jgi:predicted ATP-grasp superfamily ATP-dependent carboligase